MNAADIMTPSVVFADPDLSVGEIAKLMLTRNVSAVPVLDRSHRLIGIVSEGDLMHRVELGTERRRSWWLRMLIGDDALARDFVQSHGRKARDVMTRTVISVNEDTPIEDIVATLEQNRIKRVPVMRDGRVVGIISRANLLRAFASRATEDAAQPTVDDRETRSRILAALKREPWWNDATCNVIVSDGIAHLWGTTESPEQREALRVVAERTAGVRGVKNHVNVVRPMVLYMA